VSWILLGTHRLHPVTYLVFQCIKSAIWAVVLILDIMAATIGDATGLAFLFSVVLFLASIGQYVFVILLH
jgi:hypothetical protein